MKWVNARDSSDGGNGKVRASLNVSHGFRGTLKNRSGFPGCPHNAQAGPSVFFGGPMKNRRAFGGFFFFLCVSRALNVRIQNGSLIALTWFCVPCPRSLTIASHLLLSLAEVYDSFWSFVIASAPGQSRSPLPRLLVPLSLVWSTPPAVYCVL